ncbi:ATP-binding cassette domain-containing protein, partial [Acidisphaera sp. L21]|uniref:ATP-binding cassette domain-containing protein n=1 Tax=Acidisphaera sp. L21 TaxID=1641851 RepID=UPI00131D6468
MTAAPLLQLESVRVHLRIGRTVVRAVDGVDLTVAPGECVGIVGESGSGKSTLARAMVQLLPNVAMSELSGRVMFDGTDIAAMPRPALRRLRRQRSFSIVFQDPLGYLNPTRRVGVQIAEALPDDVRRAARVAAVHALLDEVGLPDPVVISR